MRLLGIDLGDKRTGLALAEVELGIVSPVKTIEVPLRRMNDLIGAIDEARRELGPDAVVVGLPLNMDGSEGPAAKRVREFASALGDRMAGTPIHLYDERLTSVDADEKMAGSGLTHKQKKARRDALAACAILRDYMASMGGDPVG